MKKIHILIFAAFEGLATCANAQAPFPTMDSITINNIDAAVLVHGDMWWNPATSTPKCVLEGDTGHVINNAGAIWMSAYDGSGALHIAAQTFRQEGNDYWPGPLDATGTLTYATSQNWAKIWKVYRSDIEYFQSLGTHTTANTPPMILTWPAKGNAYAQGNSGAALTITDEMAPFIDLNGNGIYEPLLGEYPDIPGDEALWWVFSDNGPTHTQTNGLPLDVEVHVMCYGYHRGTTIDNVVYYVYTLVNKSVNNYSNFRIAQWDNFQIEAPNDDFIGFDSVWRMGITYNATRCDSCGGGTPPYADGAPPTSAVTMVVLPGDAAPSYVPVGCFSYYLDDTSAIGIPVVDTQYNNYMRSKSRSGGHVKDDFQGPGIPSSGYNGGPDCNYVFTGNPGNNSQWSQCAVNDDPDGWCSVLSSNDFTLSAGGTQEVVFALIAADTTGGCPETSFDSIIVVADTAWSDYFSPLPPLAVAAINPSINNSIKLYPNPAHDQFYIEDKSSNTGDASITIYNAIGQVVAVPVENNTQQSQIDVSTLPDGLYNVLYRKGTMQTCVKFIKE